MNYLLPSFSKPNAIVLLQPGHSVSVYTSLKMKNLVSPIFA